MATRFGNWFDERVGWRRSWEANPPVELPPEVAAGSERTSGSEIYAGVCVQCHGPSGEGLIGPSLRAWDFQTEHTDQDLFNIINQGHGATAMIAWGEILTSDQIQQAVINTGDHAPVVIPGDAEGSLLGQKILGTHAEGIIMPPAGRVPDDEIQVILDWIAAGVPDN